MRRELGLFLSPPSKSHLAMSRLSTTDLAKFRLLNRRSSSSVSYPLRNSLPPPSPPCESGDESSITHRLLTILTKPNWQRSPSLKSLVPKLTPSHLSSLFSSSSSRGLDPKTAIDFNFWINQNPNFNPKQQHSVRSYASLINLVISNGYVGVVYKIRLWMIKRCDSLEDALFVLDLCRKMNIKESKHKLAIGCYNTLLNTLAKFGLVDEMKSLYNEMLQEDNKVCPDVKTYNKMVNGYCKVGNVAEAKRYVDKIVEAGLDPDFFTYTSLILGYCQSKDLGSAFKVFEEMGLKGIRRNMVAYTYLIHGLCEAKRVDEAMDLFMKMKEEGEEGCNPTIHTYTVLIKALLGSGRKSEALGLLKEMSENGIEPNVHTYTVLIHSYCGDCEMGEARRLLDHMLKKGLMPNVITYNALIDGYCKQGMVEEALEVVVLMESRKLHPNTRTYNELINGFCKKNVHKAMSLLSKMMERQVAPNVVTYNSLIDGQCRSGNFDSAYRLLSVMSERGLVPDQWTYNSFIDCLCKRKRVEEARALFDSLEEKGVKANVVMYTALIDGYCKSNSLDEARLILEKMLSKECLPNSSTFNALIHGLCTDGKLEEATLLEERMVKMGLRRTITTDTILIHRLLKEGDFDNANTRFKQMLSLCETKPDVHTYTLFIQAYCNAGRVEEAVEMIEKMRENGVSPDSITYSSLIKYYGDLGMTDSAFNVLKLMVDNGCEPSLDTFLSLIKHLHETKHGKNQTGLLLSLVRFDTVLDLLEKMVCHGVKPEAKSYEKIIFGLSRAGNLITTEKVLDHMRLHEGLTPSETVLNVVLTCSCKLEQHYDEASKLVDDMLQVGYLPNLESCKILICGLYKRGESERGRSVFDKMVRFGGYSRDELAWKILVDGVAKMGLVDVFYDLFGLMEKNGCKFSSHTYQLLIKGPS